MTGKRTDESELTKVNWQERFMHHNLDPAGLDPAGHSYLCSDSADYIPTRLKVQMLLHDYIQIYLQCQSHYLSTQISSASLDGYLKSLEQMFSAFGRGDFRGLPHIRVCDRDSLAGARAGYIARDDILCLARDFAREASPAELVSVLIEEICNAVEVRSQQARQ